MSPALSRSFSFRTERFDYASELPEAYNAGNRFYGRDLAEHLAAQLTARGFPATFGDEDWGWLVESARESSRRFLVAVYNLSDHREGGRPGANAWGLWLRAFESQKFFGLLPRSVEVDVPAELEVAVRASIEDLGARVEAWEEGPA